MAKMTLLCYTYFSISKKKKYWLTLTTPNVEEPEF